MGATAVIVATVLTACGIETIKGIRFDWYTIVATVLTACGIETDSKELTVNLWHGVATVLTACGIETM